MLTVVGVPALVGALLDVHLRPQTVEVVQQDGAVTLAEMGSGQRQAVSTAGGDIRTHKVKVIMDD